MVEDLDIFIEEDIEMKTKQFINDFCQNDFIVTLDKIKNGKECHDC